MTKMLIFKVLLEKEFSSLRITGEFKGTKKDLLDGFIHFSTKSQVRETLDRHFKDEKSLILVAVETKRLAKKLCWEKARDNELFPHYYGILKFDDTLWVAPITLKGSKHVIPNGF